MTKANRTYYLGKDEPEPYRPCKSKRFITKVMFVCAVARPRYDAHKEEDFNGLIGIWPYATTEAAKQSSKDQPKGTLVTKPIAAAAKKNTIR